MITIEPSGPRIRVEVRRLRRFQAATRESASSAEHRMQQQDRAGNRGNVARFVACIRTPAAGAANHDEGEMSRRPPAGAVSREGPSLFPGNSGQAR